MTIPASSPPHDGRNPAPASPTTVHNDAAEQRKVPRELDAAIDWMNQRYAIVMDGGKTLAIIQDFNESLHRHTVIWSSPEEIRKLYHRTFVY